VWRRWLPLAAVVALLAAAMFASLYANPSFEAVPDTPGDGRTPPRLGDQPAPPPVTPPPTAGPLDPVVPTWMAWVIAAACLTAVVVVLGALVIALLRERLLQRKVAKEAEASPPPTMAETQERVRAAVDEGLADLDDADADPRRAVIACWVRLEEAAAVAGTPREPGDTSTELVARLLESHMVSADVLAGLAAVYREARYATHTVDAAMRDQARAALGLLREQLMAGNL